MAYDKTEFVRKTNELRNRIKDLKDQYKKEAQASFAAATKEFFEEFPIVEGLHWVQYTPHWNDGEECYFSVHDVGNWVRGEDKNDLSPYGDEGGINTSGYGVKTTAASLAADFGLEIDDNELDRTMKGLDAITSFISSIDNNTMEDMFGNHVHVFVTRDGVLVDEHEHD